MTNNGQVALAFTSGYLFGRGHRVRSALALAGLTAGRRLVAGRGAMGPQQLKSTELGKVSHQVRDQLMAAGRSAAMSAASHRIDALSDRLEQRAEALRSGSDGHKEGGRSEGDRKESRESRESKARDEERGGERRSGREERSRGSEQESRHKRTADRPERPGKRAGTGGSERRDRG